ncbi:MAG: tRNA (adenosine(37)-N6)-threonylcarbamoyltransferase complex ATPase subunit type 1 TsaE [Methylotenera sp.]|uniref:tRNA (adenosine(37)-N6)-threonylcarbamoyltransferase complex ATPase subunit type 1 TsaE n=1 Tax=Methylotenera sp. TaxID=2051956 RepID=UPI0018026D0C|nr:tRNA (adenosine(37)-N6)-threonylcarbamoyltransferase complex ATPase subunit type 1 TsaE [Methylotenera sp.]NOU25964.1 tRNA (adenosine(37)-N6)-threonylcarbamoyltransferase complex ATPase subunit type 1 TsaE [Methylotenera sp.]
MVDNFTLDLADEAATLQFGMVLAKVIQPNLTIYLHGDLGAGKTTLVRGLLRALAYIGKVKSPTYTLVEPYEIQPNKFKVFSSLMLYHFDLYRFNDEEEWESAGFRDYFNASSVCIIEWPEKAAHVLPTPDLNITLEIKNVGKSLGRHLIISAHSSLGQQCLSAISTESS